MNQDLANELKVKLVPRDEQTHCGFINSLNNRSLGLGQKTNPIPKANIQAVAEDELVRKIKYRELRCEMPGTPRSTFLMVFSPDGTKVASTHGNHQIYITDVRTGKHIKTLVGHPRTPWCIAFHPTSNQIIASGCLGGQVRIWDLNGGSEVWTAENQSVIASIAFHPDDRLLVIATFNKLFFWDWSSPEPFMNVPTATNKEKVRYVAFDKLGHKLITGITNNPQTRWERVRSAVPVPRPADRSANFYRRRITSRILNSSPVNVNTSTPSNNTASTLRAPSESREPLSSIPERERRITTCYRDLVHQYEALVHRYLQIYRPPVMIDQGTDPMESDNNGQTSRPSPGSSSRTPQPTPSTSGTQHSRKSTMTQATKKKATEETLPSKLPPKPAPSTSGKRDAKNLDSNRQNKEDTARRQPNTSSNTNPSVSSESETTDEEFSYFKRRRLDLRKQRERLFSRFSSKLPKSGSGSTTGETASNPEPSGNQPSSDTSAVNSENSETLLKMKIKITPSNTEQNQASTSGATPSSSNSTQNNNSSNIKDLIRNVEIMLARFRENLEQRVQLRIDLPVPSQPQPSTSNASRGTSTSSVENNKPSGATKRPNLGTLRRPRRRPPSPPNLWTFSSESSLSSSDDEVRPKQPRLDNNKRDGIGTVKNLLFKASENGDSGSQQNSENKANQPSTSGTSTSSINIRIDLSAVRNDNNGGNKRTQANQTNVPELTTHLTDAEHSDRLTANLPAQTSSPNESNADELPYISVVNSPNQIPREDSEPSTSINNPQRVPCIGSSMPRTLWSRRTPVGFIRSSNPYSYLRRSPSTTYIDGSNDPSDSSTDLPSSRLTNPTGSDVTRPRILSHRLSAFHPLRWSAQRMPCILRYVRGARAPHASSNLPTMENSSQNYNDDEVINYAERVGEEEPLNRHYHPFDPPPEMLSINPENIGIGNMYSNIVQELESSLNDIRLIQLNRLGETSDMLSSFSERLESIMNQSNAILRNLSSSINSLSASNSGINTAAPNRDPEQEPETADGFSPNLSGDNDRSSARVNPITSDHTYPLNPENPANMSPLMLSLHLTVTHIQRQARLLRQQVESIERIDRAMLEVAQLQSVRQMFDEIHRFFSSDVFNESGNSGSEVSNVRQMMAGTRISDSNPNQSASERSPPESHETNQEVPDPQPSTSGLSSDGIGTNVESPTPSGSTSSNRSRARKNYPHCLFLMHSQYRRHNRNKQRLLRRNIYRRFVPSRTGTRPVIDISTSQGRGYFNFYSPNTLLTITSRLQHYLMEHCRFIGRTNSTPPSTSGTRSDIGEHVMTLRLSNCRQRINRILGRGLQSNRQEFASVTVDGSSRFAARQALSFTLDTLSKYMDLNADTQNFVPSSRLLIEEVIDLARLLAEVLLLQIVDSIPPPTGMNLDPERENLSLRIDQMCSRMLDNPLTGQSIQLTRSLRLMRLTVRHATQALIQTYTERRARLPGMSNDDNANSSSRMQLIDHLNNTLRNIERHWNQNSDMIHTRTDWYRTLSSFLNLNSRPENESNVPADNASNNELNDLNRETGESSRSAPTVEDANSSDDNVNVPDPLDAILRSPIYVPRREEPSTSRDIPLNVPTVQINDLPVSEPPQIASWRRAVFYRQYMEFQRTPFRPQLLHPLQYAHPFEEIIDDGQREHIYDTDIIATVTPNHRIQVWKFSRGIIPNISNANKNVVVNECKIHNDASVDLASDGSILVTLLPSGGYVHTNRLGVYSLEWATLGQCLYVTSFEQNAVSVSLSPVNRHLIVGLATRRASIIPNDKWTMARIFVLEDKDTSYSRRLVAIRELEQNRDTGYMSVNCIRWLPTSGQGLVFATNTGQLRLLT